MCVTEASFWDDDTAKGVAGFSGHSRGQCGDCGCGAGAGDSVRTGMLRTGMLRRLSGREEAEGDETGDSLIHDFCGCSKSPETGNLVARARIELATADYEPAGIPFPHLARYSD